ncbi:MAG TPA: hypothetical protein VGI99_09570, partial [Gemmataceae bacterium]
MLVFQAVAVRAVKSLESAPQLRSTLVQREMGPSPDAPAVRCLFRQQQPSEASIDATSAALRKHHSADR